MYYQIEAVRWDAQGRLSEVCWRSIDVEGERLVRGEAHTVPVVDAARTCAEHEVRVYVPGSTGRFFRMMTCPQGLDAEVDGAGTPLRERLAHLPTF